MSMDVTHATELAAQLATLSTSLTAALTPDAIPTPPLNTVSAFDDAYHAAAPGDVLVLDVTLRYDHALVIDKAITLQSAVSAAPGVRMTALEPAPTFLAGLTVIAADVQLVGLDVRHTNPATTIVTLAGDRTVLRHIRVLGDAAKGGKRGIAYTGSDGRITDSYVSNIFQPAQDTQAIYSDNMGPGQFFIDNCYLAASGEVVMFGGGDAPEGRDPHDTTLNNSTLDKLPAWTVFDTPNHHTEQTKVSLELKNMRRFTCQGCTFRRGGGISQGQGGYAFDFTPRNQSGGNPMAAVQDVLIEDYTIDTPGSGILTITGEDNVHPSERTRNIVLRRGVVTGVDHNALSPDKTTGRLLTFDHAPENVTIDTLAVQGVGIKAIGYFQGAVPPTGVVLLNITVDNGGATIPYRWKMDANTGKSGMGPAALRNYMPDIQMDASVV